MANEIDQRLADLALSAVATLAREMHGAGASKDRIAAANSILDRLGYGRTTRVQKDLADQEIRNALDAITQKAIETAPEKEPKPVTPSDGITRLEEL